MILSYVSLVLVVYALIRFVLPLPCGLPLKVLLAGLILLVSRKYQIYALDGTPFFAPDLPRPLLVCLEFAFAALLLFVVLLLIRDLVALLLWLTRLCGSTWQLPFSPTAQNVALLVLALAAGGYGVWQAVRVPDVRTVEVAVPDLPKALDGFTLVQLTDLHIGPMLKGPWLQEVVAKTNALAPDLVVLTGDMVDGTPEKLAADIRHLQDLRARHGVLGVTGNHEYLYGVQAWTKTFGELGVDMLFNGHKILAEEKDGQKAQLVVAGIPDRRAAHVGETTPDAALALANVPARDAEGQKVVRLLLAHQPGAFVDSAADIQLSGHTHGGMFFFLKTAVAPFNRGFVQGTYTLGDRTLYVSSGTGLWNGMSCRLGVPSEITRLVLRAA